MIKGMNGEEWANWRDCLIDTHIEEIAKDPRIIEAVLRGAQNYGVSITDKEVKLISKLLADKQGGE